MNYGFIRIASAVPPVKVADCKFNAQQIENLIIQAEGKGVEVICFPELCITAYTCGDLFSQQLLIDQAEMALISILDFTRSLNIISIVGLPVSCNGLLLNCAAVIQKGKILALVPKSYLPNYGEFYEQRWFSPSTAVGHTSVLICGQVVPLGVNVVFNTPSCRFGVEICEDLWAPIPPSSSLALSGAEVIFNLSADNESAGKYAYLKSLLAQQSSRLIAGYVYASCGFGESTQDMVFSGKALVYENGALLAESPRFTMKEQLVITEIDVERIRTSRRRNTTFAASVALHLTHQPLVIDTELFTPKDIELTRIIPAHPFVPEGEALQERCHEVFHIQVEGLAKRLVHTQSQGAVVGISGGLDSTLALLVCVATFDQLQLPRRNIIGVTMPGFGTTGRTYHNAVALIRSLGVSLREVDIKKACLQHFSDLGADPAVHDVTYENSQARERTQILMDMANQCGALVVGTGDLSELALGWATYNGDHMSMYGVNASVPKTLIPHLVTWAADHVAVAQAKPILLDIINTPISPELIPADEQGEISQKTEDLVGPYELHDFFLYHTLHYGFGPAKTFMLARKAFGTQYTDQVIKKWITTFFRRFFAQQFKRSCLPDGPKVGSCTLSPRGDWRMPTDASSAAWLDECNNLPD